MKFKNPRQTGNIAGSRRSRLGMMTPVVILTLVTATGLMALVVNSFWMEMTIQELRNASEAAALATAVELVDESRYAAVPPTGLLRRSRLAAQRIALQNRASGMKVGVNPTGSDIAIGRRVLNRRTGQNVFLETEYLPDTVIVTARPAAAIDFPLSIIGGSVRSGMRPALAAEARIHGNVIGLKPTPTVPAPAMPLAIRLKQRMTDSPVLGWTQALSLATDGDSFSFNGSTGRVEPESDGIPELRIRSTAFGERDTEAELVLLAPNRQERFAAFQRQIRYGWRADDLVLFGGQLEFTSGPIWISGSRTVANELVRPFREQIGQPKVFPLYRNSEVGGPFGSGRFECVAIVALRIMTVRGLPDNAVEFVLQPCVFSSPAAFLVEESGDPSGAISPQTDFPTLFKIQLHAPRVNQTRG